MAQIGRYIVGSPYPTTGGWKARWTEIIKARKELLDPLLEKEPYTRASIERQVAALKEAHYTSIINGILGEINEAISDYQSAQAKLQAARQAEARSWDPGKLAAELTVAQALANMAISTPVNPLGGGPTAAQKLEVMWKDAQLSGDRHRIRAISEVLASVQDKPVDHETRLTAATIARQAGEKLAELRDTPEMQGAVAKIEEAHNYLANVYRAERQGMIDMGEGDPLGLFASGPVTSALKRIQRDPQTGQVNILAADDPEVTGYDLSGISEGTHD